MTDNIIDAFDRFMAVSHFDDEMAEAHSPTEDAIHNWIVDHQEDDELIAGILKHLDRTIKGAMGYCIRKASKSDYRKGQGAMVDDATVFSWVKEYFTAEEVEISPVIGKMTTGSKDTTKKPKKKTPKVKTKSVVGKMTTGNKDSTKKPKKKTPKVETKSVVGEMTTGSKEPTKPKKKQPKEVGKQLDLFSDLSVEEGEF